MKIWPEFGELSRATIGSTHVASAAVFDLPVLVQRQAEH